MSIKVLTVLPLRAGTYETGTGIADAFNQLEGVEAETFNCADNADGYDKLFRSQLKEESQVINMVQMHVNLLFMDHVMNFRPDYIFLISYSVINAEYIAKAKSLGAKVIYWMLDDYRVDHTMAIAPDWAKVVFAVDIILSFQTGEIIGGLKEKFPDKEIVYFPAGFNPNNFLVKQLQDDELKQYSSDISFCGAAYPNRLRFFSSVVDERYKFWGVGWSRQVQQMKQFAGLTENVEGIEKLAGQAQIDFKWVSTEEENKIYNASKINVNLHSSHQYPEIVPCGDFLNPRLFCICGAGGFQLVDKRMKIEEFFEPDKEIVTFETKEEFKQKADKYLNDDEARKKIARAGFVRANAEHTYLERVRALKEKYF